MRANLIVYSMAARAERPELERRAARARLVAPRLDLLKLRGALIELLFDLGAPLWKGI